MKEYVKMYTTGLSIRCEVGGDILKVDGCWGRRLPTAEGSANTLSIPFLEKSQQFGNKMLYLSRKLICWLDLFDV